jgi:hypothetical protein
MAIGRRWKGLVGAAGLAVALALAFGGGDGHAQTQLRGWSTPVNLGSIINSGYNEELPHISPDGLSLYFISDRPRNGSPNSPPADFDIFVSHRQAPGDPWEPPKRLGSNINTNLTERGPCLSPDGHYLFFSSNRTDLEGDHGGDNPDLYKSYREDVNDDRGWQVPENLGGAVNTTNPDFGAALIGDLDGKLSALLFGRRVGGQNDIYMSRYIHGFFRPATPVTELNSPSNDFRPTIRPDGLELFFNSDRDSASNDIWVSTRSSLSSPWSAPSNVGPPINTNSEEQFPALSADDRMIIFSSNRDGTDNDLYVSTRQPLIHYWP